MKYFVGAELDLILTFIYTIYFVSKINCYRARKSLTFASDFVGIIHVQFCFCLVRCKNYFSWQLSCITFSWLCGVNHCNFSI